jgi:hypothetical protein
MSAPDYVGDDHVPQVDEPDVLKTLKPGDQITAKVYDGDCRVLHFVHIVPPANGIEKEPQDAKIS